MTVEQRVATALERIEDCLTELLDRLPPPRPASRALEDPGVDANQAFMAGQFKRRAGDIIPVPSPGELHTGSPPIGTQLDPWIKRDTPAIDEEP